MSKIKQLKEKRAALVKDMRALQDDNPTFTADHEEKWDKMEAEVSGIEASIKREERLAKEEKALKAGATPPPATPPGVLPDEDDNKRPLASKAYNEAFWAMTRHGRQSLQNSPKGGQFLAALEAGTDSEGGYLVPEHWATEIVTDQGEQTVVRSRASVMATSSDRNIPIDTGRATFTWIDEEAAYSTNDPAFGNVVLQAHKLGGIIKVSEELLQDEAFNLPGYLQVKAAEEFDYREELAFISGNDSGKPQGLEVVTAVGGVNLAGITLASATAITADEFIDIFHALAIRHRARANWIISDTHLKSLRKLKDTTNQYIWQPGLREGEPDMLLGRPLNVSDASTTPATTVRSVLFGDLGYYQIVDRLGITVQRLNELYAENGQVGFKFTKRVDGHLTRANALTYGVQA